MRLLSFRGINRLSRVASSGAVRQRYECTVQISIADGRQRALGLPEGPAAPQPSRLTEQDAIDIWIARWLRIRPIDLIRRYRCDPRRLYEIWEEVRFTGSREKALALVEVRYPTLKGRIDCGAHRRIPHTPDPNQLSFFERVE